MQFPHTLAQFAESPATATSHPATSPLAAQTKSDAAPKETTAAPGNTYHVAWEKWIRLYQWEYGAKALIALILVLLLGAFFTRKFKNALQTHRLQRATKAAILAIAIYAALWTAHTYLMADRYDILAIIFHKTFVAVMLIVAVRYVDRLLILALLTRISGRPPSRFVHQIIIAVISIFVIAGYCSWAFGFELASFLAGSAVISIVLGLALQETLGNFFSGMVLQASVPFKPGDWIQIGGPDSGIEGRVVEMTWRAVTLITPANNHLLIPNSSVAKERIVNYHAPSAATATSVTIGLDYNLPPNDAKRVLLQAAKDSAGVLPDPPPSVGLASFGDSAINYKVVVWTDQPQRHGAVEEAVRVNLWYRLNQAGFNIPFPMRTIEMSDADKKLAVSRDSAKAARLAALKKSAAFAHLAPEPLDKLAAETHDFSLAAGQILYKQDDLGDSLFLLLSGTANISIRTNDTPPRELDAGDFSAPTIFGEVSAFTGQPRSATLRAKTDIRAIEIDHDHLQDLLAHDPELTKHFSDIVARRQAEREELLKKLGATPAATTSQAKSESVLDRVTHFFTRLRH